MFYDTAYNTTFIGITFNVNIINIALLYIYIYIFDITLYN